MPIHPTETTLTPEQCTIIKNTAGNFCLQLQNSALQLAKQSREPICLTPDRFTKWSNSELAKFITHLQTLSIRTQTTPKQEFSKLPLSSKIRKLRLERGWSMSELARRSLLSAPAVSQLEKDISKRPRSETIEKIANAFAISAKLLSEN